MSGHGSYYAASIPAWQIAVLFLAIVLAWAIPFEGRAWARRHDETPPPFDWARDCRDFPDRPKPLGPIGPVPSVDGVELFDGDTWTKLGAVAATFAAMQRGSDRLVDLVAPLSPQDRAVQARLYPKVVPLREVTPRSPAA